MAGLGFKDFQVGEVLTSSDVDGYLMQQSVMRFADSAARGSALGTAAGTAVALAEGMVSYVQDTDSVEVYDGSSWVSVSAVRQVVQTEVTAPLTATVASLSTTELSDLTVTITPKTSDSRVVLDLTLVGRSSPEQFAIIIERDGTPIGVGDAASSRTSVTSHGIRALSATLDQESTSLTMVDSPATTSAVTYTVNLFNVRANTNTYYINRTAADTNAASYTRAASRFIATEVAL